MAKTATPTAAPAAAPANPAPASRLRELLERIAARRAAARAAGTPFVFGMGMNLKPDRFHLDHTDGEVIAALKTIGEAAPELLSELP